MALLVLIISAVNMLGFLPLGLSYSDTHTVFSTHYNPISLFLKRGITGLVAKEKIIKILNENFLR